MNTRKEWFPVFFLIPFLLLLAACDGFENDAVSLADDFATSEILRKTSEASQTQTAAPRETWTRQAHQTLTALPANETATGVAMGATETSAAVATQQLDTRQAQTVAANLTATKIALERGTNTPTFTRTLTPSNTPRAPALSTPIVSALPITPTIGNTLVTQLPIDQIFVGESPIRAASNVTDTALIYSPPRVDFLNQNGAQTLINNWRTTNTSFTFVTNWFPTTDAAIQWQALSAQSSPATAAKDQPFEIGTFNAAPFQKVECKTGERTISGRQLKTGYCDVFARNIHVGFNFLTTGELQAQMKTNAPLILNSIANNVE